MEKNKKSRTPNVIPPAGQRRDMTRQDNNAAVTLGENLREAIAWREEHRQ